MKRTQVLTASEEMRTMAHRIRERGKTIVFVPTMGALHEGHLALFREGKKHGNLVIASIFVNPKQFNDPQDFEKYTRDLKGDLEKCRSVGVDIVFTPAEQEIYPSEESSRTISLPEVAKPLEGEARPGHFEGVVAVVSRLFRIVQPHVAVFGLKDYQQVRVIEDTVAREGFDVLIVRHPTVRESDGLAMSSRNVRLSAEGRRKALTLSRSLKKALSLYEKGERRVGVLQAAVLGELSKTPGLRIDYAVIADAETLAVFSKNTLLEKPAVAALAIFVEGVRLIDNVIFE